MKCNSSVLHIAWAFALLTFFVAGPASAQEVNRQNVAVSDRPSDLEGNWSVEWHDYPEKGQVTQAAARLYRNWEQVCVEIERGGCRYENKLSQTDNAWNLSYSVSPFEHGGGGRLQEDAVAPNGRLNIQWGYGTLGHWGGKSELQQTGRNEIRGRWSYGETGGNEVWRRAVPRVQRVVFKSKSESEATPGGVPAKVHLDWWGVGEDRYVRASFQVEIYGENLWGHHLIDFGGAVDIEFNLEFGNNILKDGSTYSSLLYNPSKVVGISAHGNIRQFTTPGLKTLYVDGQAYPFELVVDGYPGEIVKSPSSQPKVAEINTSLDEGEVRTDEFGVKHSAAKDEDARRKMISTDAKGNQLTTVYDSEGNIVDQEEVRVTPKEPGEAYFENEIGGKYGEWEKLPLSTKQRYAQSEAAMKGALENQLRREAQEAQKRLEDGEYEKWRMEQRKILDEKLAVIVKEQEAADAKYQEFLKEEARVNKRDEVAQQMKDYDEQIRIAQAKGDQAEVNRLIKKADALHDKSHDLYTLTPVEEAQVREMQEIRDRVTQRVRNRARHIARHIAANQWFDTEKLQDAKESYTGVGQYLLSGAEVQEKSKKEVRMSDRELASATAMQVEIGRELADPNIPPKEKQVLANMLRIQDLQAEGARKHLNDIGTLTAIGYGVDMATTVTGGKIVQGVGKVVAYGVTKVMAKGTAKRFVVATTRQGALEATGRITTKAATSLTRKVLGDGAAQTVKGALKKDVGKAVGAGATKVLGQTTTGAIRTVAAKAGQVATTEIPNPFKKAKPPAPGAAAAIANSTDNIAADVADSAVSKIPPKPASVAVSATDNVAPKPAPAAKATATPEAAPKPAAFSAKPATSTTPKPEPTSAKPALEIEPKPSQSTPKPASRPAPKPAQSAPKPTQATPQPQHTGKPAPEVQPRPTQLAAASPTNLSKPVAVNKPPVLTSRPTIQNPVAVANNVAPKPTAMKNPPEVMPSASKPASVSYVPPKPFQPVTSVAENMASPKPSTRPVASLVDEAVPSKPVQSVADDVAPTPEPLYGNKITPESTLEDLAKNPRVRTETPSGVVDEFPQKPVDASYRRPDFVEARSAWKKVPQAEREAFDQAVRDAIDEAAAMGDKWAIRLQKDLNSGKMKYEYEPGLDCSGIAPGKGVVQINPIKSGKKMGLESPDKVASTLIHEFAHSWKGPKKWAAANKPGFKGSATKGEYNEVRAFMAEAGFNKNLQKARKLNGKAFDDSTAKELNELMKVDSLPGGGPSMSTGLQARKNIQEGLVDNYKYGEEFAGKPDLAAERLSSFRGGSMKDVRKRLRNARGSNGEITPEYEKILKEIQTTGGRTSARSKTSAAVPEAEPLPKKIDLAKAKEVSESMKPGADKQVPERDPKFWQRDEVTESMKARGKVRQDSAAAQQIMTPEQLKENALSKVKGSQQQQKVWDYLEKNVPETNASGTKIREELLKTPRINEVLSDLAKGGNKAQGARHVLRKASDKIDKEGAGAYRSFEDELPTPPNFKPTYNKKFGEKVKRGRSLRQGPDAVDKHGDLEQFKAYSDFDSAMRELTGFNKNGTPVMEKGEVEGGQVLKDLLRYADRGWLDGAGQPVSGKIRCYIDKNQLGRELTEKEAEYMKAMSKKLTEEARAGLNKPDIEIEIVVD